MGENSTDGDQDKRINHSRGLAALFGEENEDFAALDKIHATKTVVTEHLHPSPFQPRREFEPGELQALADSITANGILQALLVRRHPEHPSEFEIVAGARRWRAAQIAQVHEIPVVIRELSDRQTLEAAIVENVQRQDLSAIEEASGYQRLMEEFHHTQADLAQAVGKSRSHIANTVRLLALPEVVKTMVMRGELSAGHGRALLGARAPEDLAKTVVARGLNVRQTERLVQKSLATGAEPGGVARDRGGRGATKDPDILALEQDVTALLGLEVAIDFQGQGGKLTIHYQTLEQLDGVLRRLSHTPPPEAE